MQKIKKENVFINLSNRWNKELWNL